MAPLLGSAPGNAEGASRVLLFAVDGTSVLAESVFDVAVNLLYEVEDDDVDAPPPVAVFGVGLARGVSAKWSPLKFLFLRIDDDDILNSINILTLLPLQATLIKKEREKKRKRREIGRPAVGKKGKKFGRDSGTLLDKFRFQQTTPGPGKGQK